MSCTHVKLPLAWVCGILLSSQGGWCKGEGDGLDIFRIYGFCYGGLCGVVDMDIWGWRIFFSPFAWVDEGGGGAGRYMWGDVAGDGGVGGVVTE